MEHFAFCGVGNLSTVLGMYLSLGTALGIFLRDGFAMHPHHRQPPSHNVPDLRREAGRWLKDLRNERGLTQLQLAGLVDVEYYTFVSQLEVGRGRIPPGRYERWAGALGVDIAVFTKNLMRFYDPEIYRLLFGQLPSVLHDTLAPSPDDCPKPMYEAGSR